MSGEPAGIDASGAPAIEPPTPQELAVPMPEDGAGEPPSCSNCQRPLAEGPFCQHCGQNQDDYHRSLPRLTGEVIGGLFDWDGRFLRTIPRLFFAPAGLTRDYLAGERVSQTPPLKMFLVVVVMVFLAGEFANQGRPLNIRNETGGPITVIRSGDPLPPGAIARDRSDSAFARWFVPAVERSLQDPDTFAASLVTWAQRLAILLLPISAATMGLMFVWHRRVLMYDHLIWTMHHLAAGGALISLLLVLGRFWPPSGLLAWLWPLHTFVHMKGTYGIGVFGTLWRMLGLVVIAGLGSLALALALVLVTVYDVGGRPAGVPP